MFWLLFNFLWGIAMTILGIWLCYIIGASIMIGLYSLFTSLFETNILVYVSIGVAICYGLYYGIKRFEHMFSNMFSKLK